MTSEVWEVPEFAGHGQAPQGLAGNVIGSPVGTNVVLVRSKDVAVSLEHLTAYPDGFAFLLVLRVRDPWSDRRATSVGDALFPRIRGGGWRPNGIPPSRLRFGVAFADGRKANNLWAERRPRYPSGVGRLAGSGISLELMGGYGSAKEGVLRLWLRPLPPPGPVTFACEWPAGEIPFTAKELDAEVILEAARRAVVLWPPGHSKPPSTDEEP